MYIGRNVKYTLFVADFKENWSFLTYYRRILKY